MRSTSKLMRIPPIGYVLFAIVLWSTGGLFIKMTTLDAFAVNCGRSLFAVLTVAIFTYRKGFRLSPFTLLTSLVYAGILTCFVYATKTTTAANAIFLQYTAPIYILILSPILLKEKFRALDLVPVLFCLAGMSLFFLETPDARQPLASNQVIGNLVALASGALFGLYVVLLRHPRSRQSKNPAVSVFYGNLLVFLFMLPFVIPDPPLLATKDIFAVIYLGVFQIGVSYLLFTTGLARGVRPFDASLIGFVEPLLNPLWVALALGETPTRWAVIGGAVILLTVAAHTLIQNRAKFTPLET